jgi:ERCC4-related helicase
MLNWFKRRGKSSKSYQTNEEWISAIKPPPEDAAILQLLTFLVKGLKASLHKYVDRDLNESVEELDYDQAINSEENTSWNMDEIEMLEDLIFQAKSCLNTELDAKAEYFIKKYEELRTLKNDPDLKVIIFTEFRSTQSMLKKILEERGYRCSDLNSQLLNQR